MYFNSFVNLKLYFKCNFAGITSYKYCFFPRKLHRAPFTQMLMILNYPLIIPNNHCAQFVNQIILQRCSKILYKHVISFTKNYIYMYMIKSKDTITSLDVILNVINNVLTIYMCMFMCTGCYYICSSLGKCSIWDSLKLYSSYTLWSFCELMERFFVTFGCFSDNCYSFLVQSGYCVKRPVQVLLSSANNVCIQREHTSSLPVCQRSV